MYVDCVDAQKAAVDEIVDCAVRWISADADYPATPPGAWQQVIPAMRLSPDLLVAARKVVEGWEKAHLAEAVRGLADVVRAIDGSGGAE